jgi:hypothetical protein
VDKVIRDMLQRDTLYPRVDRAFARKHGLDMRRTYTLRLKYHYWDGSLKWRDVQVRWTGHAAEVHGKVLAVFLTKERSLIFTSTEDIQNPNPAEN